MKTWKKIAIVIDIVVIAIVGMVVYSQVMLKKPAPGELTIGEVNDRLLYSSFMKWNVDSVLGSPFKTYPIELENVHATLIEYPFGSSRPIDVEPRWPSGIILYVHGYNEYYFNRELAQKADSAGYAFFAIDLHGYGRSFDSLSVRCDMNDVSEYYEELDYAIEMAWVIVKNSLSQRMIAQMRDSLNDDESLIAESFKRPPQILIGHSLGGLIASTYAANRPNLKLDAIVLNSPFLEMSFNYLIRKTIVPLVAAFGYFFPEASLGTTGNPNYAYSLLKSEKGEWEYDTTWKSYDRPETKLHWMRAVYKGQERVRDGLNLKMPILAMHSDCSVNINEWVDEYTHCDGVLDANLFDEQSLKLGDNVKIAVIHDGMHDLYLSKKAVRDEAYKTTFEFIDSCVRKSE